MFINNGKHVHHMIHEQSIETVV